MSAASPRASQAKVKAPMTSSPSFVVVVPARRASSRLPEKPLADIGGAPMIVRVLRRAALSSASQVVCATDDDGIAEVVRGSGFVSVKTGAHDSGTSRVAEAAALLGLGDDDIVVNLQGDEPFMEPELLSRLAALVAEKNPSCATVARPIRDAAEFWDSSTVKVVADANGDAMYFSRAPIPFPRDGESGRTIPPDALAHLGVYACRVSQLRRFVESRPTRLEEIERLEQLRILGSGGRIALLTTESQSFGVDTPSDLAKARERWTRENK